MKTIVKILLAFDVPDDLAARKKFKEVSGTLLPVIPEQWNIREMKMTEDGTGRLLEKWEKAPPES